MLHRRIMACYLALALEKRNLRFNFITFRWLMGVFWGERKAILMQRLTWFIATCAWLFSTPVWHFVALLFLWVASAVHGAYDEYVMAVLSTALKLWFTNCEINIKFSITPGQLQQYNFDFDFFHAITFALGSRPGCPTSFAARRPLSVGRLHRQQNQ